MEAFTKMTAKAVPIDIANCDTDQIIPARFLRRARWDLQDKTFLFHDLRFDADGSSKGFVFDDPGHAGARIIVADKNWGCGSSRENAVTALQANDIRAVIAPSIADIHYNNCTKRGVVPVELPVDVVAAMREHLHASPGAEITVDLETQTVTGPDGATHGFEIGAYDRHRMLNGLDEIAYTLEFDDAISAFENQRRQTADWLY